MDVYEDRQEAIDALQRVNPNAEVPEWTPPTSSERLRADVETLRADVHARNDNRDPSGSPDPTPDPTEHHADRMSDEHRFGTWDFDVEKFTQMLSGKQAYQLLHFPALICPCRNRGDGSPDRECTNCGGLGYTWTAPESRTIQEAFYAGSQKRPAIIEHPWLQPEALTAVWLDDEQETPIAAHLEDGHVVFDDPEPAAGARFIVEYEAPLVVKGLATQLSAHREWRDIGEFDVRDLHLTVDRTAILPDGDAIDNPAWEAGEHDRFLFPFARVRKQDVLWRGTSDHLTYAFVHRIDTVQSIDPAYVTTTYQESTHFTVDHGRIVWEPGEGPSDQMPYAVNYVAAPEYFVLASLPQVRHSDGQDLPRRMMLRVWELYARPGASYGR